MSLWKNSGDWVDVAEPSTTLALSRSRGFAEESDLFVLEVNCSNGFGVGFAFYNGV